MKILIDEDFYKAGYQLHRFANIVMVLYFFLMNVDKLVPLSKWDANVLIHFYFPAHSSGLYKCTGEQPHNY